MQGALELKPKDPTALLFTATVILKKTTLLPTLLIFPTGHVTLFPIGHVTLFRQAMLRYFRQAMLRYFRQAMLRQK